MAEVNPSKRHPNFQDLTGMTFGKWKVLSLHSRDKYGNLRWLCRCECGHVKSVQGGGLKNGNSRSCKRCAKTTHGMTHSIEFATWRAMIKRCRDENNDNYANYGGRGITITERWMSFQAFFEDMGRRPSSAHTIERRNNNAGYSKDNCYWATPKEQARNRRNNRLLTYGGKTMCVAKWAEEISISKSVLFNRLKAGWSVERALTTPSQVKKWASPMIQFNGKTMFASNWAKECDMPYSTLSNRLKAGWSIEKALTTPVQVHKRRS